MKLNGNENHDVILGDQPPLAHASFASRQIFSDCASIYRWLSACFGRARALELQPEWVAVVTNEAQTVQHLAGFGQNNEEARKRFSSNRAACYPGMNDCRIVFPEHYGLLLNPLHMLLSDDEALVAALGGVIEETTHAYHMLCGPMPSMFVLEAFASMMRLALLPGYYQSRTGKTLSEERLENDVFKLLKPELRMEWIDPRFRLYASGALIVKSMWEQAKSRWPDAQERTQRWVEFLVSENVPLLGEEALRKLPERMKAYVDLHPPAVQSCRGR